MLLTRTRLTTGPGQEHVYINVPGLGANESPAMSNKQLRNRFGLGSFPMSIGSVDWPVQTQKILYLAYLNWSLPHFFLILFIQTTFSFCRCIPSFSSYGLTVRFSSRQDCANSLLCHILCACTRPARFLDAS